MTKKRDRDKKRTAEKYRRNVIQLRRTLRETHMVHIEVARSSDYEYRSEDW